jgi:branched-chain amino acid transport system permease protein
MRSATRSLPWVGLTVLVGVILLILPLFLARYGLYIMSMWAVMTIAAIGLNLTLGYAGQVSLAQGAFVGIGAYCAGILTTNFGWNGIATIPVAIVLCFAIGWLLGYPALRVQHHYLAFVTLAFSTLAFLVFRNEEWLTKGIYGIENIHRPILFGWRTSKPLPFYFLCLGSLAVASALAWWVVRSPWGRAFVALRENPVRALSLGVDVRRYTLVAFAIGSAFGGVSGVLYALLVQFVEPPAFGLALSLNILMMVIVGGSGTFFGPYLGTMIAVLLPEWLRLTDRLAPLIPDGSPWHARLVHWLDLPNQYYLILYSLFVIVLIAHSPRGILGYVEAKIAERRTRHASTLRVAAAPTPLGGNRP